MIDILGLIPCEIGIKTIAESMNGLLDAMEQFPPAILGQVMSWAKMIGCCIALGVGANECYQMMLGKRGMDVMKILHIVLISFCITWSGTIVNMAGAPGKTLAALSKGAANEVYGKVKVKEEAVQKAQEEFLTKLRNQDAELEAVGDAEDNREWYEEIQGAVEDFKNMMVDKIKAMAMSVEMTICEWVSAIIKLLGEVAFQVAYYGILLTQIIFLQVLGAFAPLMFAISLSPHYKSAWSQWLSKYISVSLWSFLAWLCMFYVYHIMIYTLDLDISSYETLSGQIGTSKEPGVISIGMQALGSTCFYVIGLLLGMRILSSVPELASWLMPGGVASSTASGMAQSVNSVVNGAAAAGGAYVGSQAAAAGGVVLGGLASGAKTIARDTSEVAKYNLTALGNSGPIMSDEALKVMNRRY